ncbi:beta-ketoacyl-ACP synthase III [Sphingobacterium sp. SG20118]|uniref:beta-ketoacyl-ACP synthase III n=1 Tax=Sphingobacterium TaxID=28453 RepID=UPI0004F5C9C2|nr:MULTISPECIES: beta-ketoacyl-ACP synthase III [Sphingobacterium]AIM35939.1 3-oxoacyl-ACP synthase [Sphingobacterium sp. ML3W]MDH5827932.1 ketoacyl-ACP synthase III [Sphingobacterium faecium]
MSKIHAAITAVGGYVPDYILTNKELETMVDTNDEWIVSRTGIKERRILKGEGKATSDLAVPAVQQLLEKRGIAATDIELIIFCTSTPDMLFPATANILADKIGATNAWGYDLQAACSGFLFGLTTGVQFIESGKHKKVLVIGADKMSSVVNYQDRNTCILFGDGCGVVLLEPNTEGMGIQDSILKTDGSGGQYLNIKGGGSLNPASHATVDAGLHYAYQEGKTVFKFAVTNMANVAAEIMEKNNLQASDIAYLVPHQANKRIIDATADRAGLPEEKVMINIQKYGNTTSATIPLCLWEWESKLKKGDNLILAAFGGGFTWGSVYLKWAY